MNKYTKSLKEYLDNNKLKYASSLFSKLGENTNLIVNSNFKLNKKLLFIELLFKESILNVGQSTLIDKEISNVLDSLNRYKLDIIDKIVLDKDNIKHRIVRL